MDEKENIFLGLTALGIELGSTRIKSVLTDYSGNVLAIGFYDWENSFINGIWTYDLQDILNGLRGSYTSLRKEVEKKYGITIKKVGVIGISAMMHGYLALDKSRKLLVPFQTWRNTNTQHAADILTELFKFNIPLRWSIAHLYQRILDGEDHVKDLDYITTLSGYIHLILTDQRVLGVGDASGMFPIDSSIINYNQSMLHKFNSLIEPYHFPWKLQNILPKVLPAGHQAGFLTKSGASLLDESGQLQAGIPLCPPEGDAGTGMVATNSVAVHTGNISAGTSTFAMIVLDKPLKKLHREIDMVTTPSGYPCAMSHANNGTSDLNAWVNIFHEFCELMGVKSDTSSLYQKLYTCSLNGDPDCGGLLAYGYYSGENVTMINEGRLAFLRTANSHFNLANFMKVNLYTSLGAVKLGLDILSKEEGVKVNGITGHGGLFKTQGVAQRYLSAAVNAPVTVMSTANEGGAWGIALLAAFMLNGNGMTLEEYLNKKIFFDISKTTIMATPEEVRGYNVFIERYKKGLDIERAAIQAMDWET